MPLPHYHRHSFFRASCGGADLFSLLSAEEHEHFVLGVRGTSNRVVYTGYVVSRRAALCCSKIEQRNSGSSEQREKHEEEEEKEEMRQHQWH